MDHVAEVLREALTGVQDDQRSKTARCSRVYSPPVLLKKGENFCFLLFPPSLSRHFLAQPPMKL